MLRDRVNIQTKNSQKGGDALAGLYVERYQDLFTPALEWGLVKTSDNLYAAIIKEIVTQNGKQLRKITWNKLRAICRLEDMQSSIILVNPHGFRKLMLKVCVNRICLISDRMAEVEALIRLSIAAKSGENEKAFLCHLQQSIGFSPGIEIINGGLLIRVKLNEDTPRLIPLPLNQRTNGHGQQGWVTRQEFLSGKYSPIR